VDRSDRPAAAGQLAKTERLASETLTKRINSADRRDRHRGSRTGTLSVGGRHFDARGNQDEASSIVKVPRRADRSPKAARLARYELQDQQQSYRPVVKNASGAPNIITKSSDVAPARFFVCMLVFIFENFSCSEGIG